MCSRLANTIWASATRPLSLGGRIDGWEVGVQFRKLLPRIPIIYTSGQVLQPTLAVQESLFFPKPYEPEAIVDACRTVLARSPI